MTAKTQTRRPGQVTFEATLTQNEETRRLEVSIYRSIHAGICGPHGNVEVPNTTDNRSVDLKDVEKALLRAGYTVDAAGWVARVSFEGMVLQAEVSLTD